VSWFRRGHAQKPDFTALEIQTSVSTLPIPIVWGRNKIAANVLWYANFHAAPGGGGKGSGGEGGLFGGGGGATTYTYYADLIMGLCEGPINSIAYVYKNQSIYTLFSLGLGSFNGSTPQATWPYLASVYPYNALAYQGTAYVWGASYNLGDAAAIGNHNFEVLGVLYGTGANGQDADPAQVIYDFLTNAQYGAGFNAASINGASLFGPGGDSSLQSYCASLGICFSPALTSQEPASSILTRWLQLLNCAAVWSGGELKFIPYGDSAVSAGNSATFKNQFSIPTPVPLSTGGFPSFITLCPQAQFVSDGGVVYAFSNIPFVFIGASVPTAAGTYGMIVPGTYIFAIADEGKPVVATFTAQNLIGYSPNLTASYALTDLDFIDEKGNKDPVQVERVDIFSLPTIQRIEVSSRNNQYSATPVEARDQSQVEIFGPRVGSTIQAHEICDEFVIGPLVAQTILQRELYVRTKFTFKLSWEYCLLDPMDIVTITDSNLGLSNYPVRIITIEEDDKGLLAITAEELVVGVSTPQFYQNASPGNFQPNQAVPSVPVNAPLIYEPPLALTNGVAQVWVGASGASYGTSTQWGGANVYVSVDNVTFSQFAVITSPLRQGFLTASLPAAAGWDSTHTLAVSLAESEATLTGTSQAATLAGATLSLVDSELIGYENANLTGTNAYNLTGLARALSGSTGAYHSTGAPFARLDGAMVKYSLPASLVGVPLYFKFQSFNVFGGGLQDLSTCAVYTFTPTGTTSPIAAQLLSGIPLDLGQVIAAPTLADDFGQVTAPVLGVVDLGQVAAVAHPIAAQLLTPINPLSLGNITTYPTVFDDFGSIADAVVDVIALGTVP
jgi:hypothetical protein